MKILLSKRVIFLKKLNLLVIDIKGLVENGFINYYGLQRFGVTNIKTHTVGKEVLKKNWKSVVELILSADDQDARADQTKKYKKLFFFLFI